MPFFGQRFSSKRNSFSACHFLMEYEKCERLHGHNYNVEIRLQYNPSKNSSPIDFRVLNSVIRQEIQLLDQKILLPKDMPDFQIHSSEEGENWNVSVGNKRYSFPKQDVLLLDGIKQTTAEELASYLHFRINQRLVKEHSGLISILEVIIAENIGNKAIFSSLPNQ